MAKSFSNLLSSFLLVYLPRTRGCGKNTIAAYRDTFILFLRFMSDAQGKRPERVSFADFTPKNVNGFLQWLETERRCGVNTCNNRLAALKSFFRYVQQEAPEWMETASLILALTAKKTTQPEIAYLSVEAIRQLLNTAQADGIRDLALLSLLYDTGARVQEVADLIISDVRLENLPPLN